MARALGSWCLLLLILSSTFDDVVSFQAAGPTRVRSSFAPSQTSASSLRSRVVPRRRLKKIPTKNPAQRRRRSGQQLDDFPWEEAETKSLVSDKATEQGDDYWYDAKSLLQFDMEAMKKLVQRPVQGQISKDRLKAEIAAPYKNNWLGLSVAAVAVIIWFVKNNPQLLDTPRILIPDL